MIRGGCVYILTNRSRVSLYTGATTDLQARLAQHREKYFARSFSARYNVYILLYYENYHSIDEAVARERYIKGKTRKWKEELIAKFNPDWKDLTEEVMKW